MLGAYAGFWVAMAVAPLDRGDWLLENLLVFAMAGVLVGTYRRFAFSTVSYGLILLFLALHAIGAHYTYSHTPIGFWIADAFGFERNHFDRVIHFGFGLMIYYPAHELIARVAGARGGWSYLLPLALCVAMSETYELIEWTASQVLRPEAALAFLGTQGDIFDAQKDTGLAALGAVLALSVTAVRIQSSRRRS